MVKVKADHVKGSEWWNRDIKELVKEKTKWRKYISEKGEQTYEEYKEARKEVAKAIKNEKKGWES